MTRKARLPQGDIDWVDSLVAFLMFGMPTATFIGSIFASITHIKDWAERHLVKDAGEWQAWQFAIVIELIPIYGLLVMWRLRKQNRQSNVPRWIFGIGLGLSMLFQIGYVGNLWELSKISVAIGPTLLALAATEILLWLARPPANKAMTPTASPTNVPPPMNLPQSPLANVPPAAPPSPTPVCQDTEPEEESLSPETSTPGTPLQTGHAPQDTPAEISSMSSPGQEDKPQATTLVPPPVSPSAGGVDMGGQDLPAPWDTAVPTPTVSGGHAPQGTPEEDTAQREDTPAREGGTPGLDPIDLERWELKLAGKTKAEIAELHNVHPRTVQRSWGKVQAAHEAAEQEKEASNA